MSTVVLPERDIVPLRTRWRDDKVFVVSLVAAALFYSLTVVAFLVFSMARAPERRAPSNPTPPAKVAPKR
jgi:hypothetical protein